MHFEKSSSNSYALDIATCVAFEAGMLVKAKAAGLEIITAKPNQLFVDLDSVYHHRLFQDGFQFLQSKVALLGLKSWRSKSGNIHVVVTAEEDFEPKVVAPWQLLLGSDAKRERWNQAKVHLGRKVFNYLFRPPTASEYDGVPIMLYCKRCNRLTCLTRAEYSRQLRLPDDLWKCGICHCGCEVLEA
jgi:hypothetical protein